MTAAAYKEETTRNQRIAADPAHSAFVSANAGSGKTRVLTNRVARLLLAGADPSTILCITFTKAAAAEMSARLFTLLGAWALADDPSLQAALSDLDGDERLRSEAELRLARRLFARALETPGGLKIQTIHSFCEGVLKRFPIEAGVPPGFTVIEDLQAKDLAAAAVAHVATSDALDIAAAFARLLEEMSGDRLRGLLEKSVTSGRRKFARAANARWLALGDEVADRLGAIPGDTAQSLMTDFLRLYPRTRFEAARAAIDATGGNPKKYLSKPLCAFLDTAAPNEQIAALTSVFLTGKGEERKSFGTAATAAIDASIEPFMQAAQAGFSVLLKRFRAAEAAAQTRALLTLLARAFAAYDDLKAARASLDFDDLIAKTRALFEARNGAQWVLYKLDKGLSHILLDEAQDTGPDAWDVIEAPLEEFFAGAGVTDRIRTFFAVGDQKQSIYSFQGANAALFKEKEEDLGKKAAAAQPFKNLPLKASFRTAAPPLAFVDALFARAEVIDNVSSERPLEHLCVREGAGGSVELWPLVPMPEKQEIAPWDAPLDARSATSRSRQLADAVALEIKRWLDGGQMLQSQGRPIDPGDIMILVQSRGALFTEAIRALGRRGVPVAGADKLMLMEDQGVLDLVSYARAALYEGDDLSLAETLKSPFFTIDEDSLYDLAANRAERRLWSALAARHHERPEWQCAHDDIAAARAIALNEGPAAFFTHILESGAPSGWRRLQARLGAPCREPVEEFLRQAHDFERAQPRSLRLFLGAMAMSDAEVSREASDAGSTVRVMTTHKAKGLEAPIVFLLDAHRRPPTNALGDILAIEAKDGSLLPVLGLGPAKDHPLLDAARDRAKRLMREEYRRLLYVGATRAKDHLIICGHADGRLPDPHKPAPAEKSWHALAEDAFADFGEAAIETVERFGGVVRRLEAPQTAPPKNERAGLQAAGGDAPLPDYLTRPAPIEAGPARRAPSTLSEGERAAYSPARGKDAYLRGRILHKLLELLPDIAPRAQEGAADRLIAHHAAAWSEEARAQLREEALSVIQDPRFAPVFAPGSRAEVPIGGRLAGDGGEILLSGQIDRLAVLPDRVLIVDYKTNRPPPVRVEDVDRRYIAQLAAYRALLQEIYPDRQIEAALLWTYDARLMPVPQGVLDEARRLTLA
ncbi:MAG: double-strand break repair helicase AddA [Parvularculaceae bacterium]|nr:double-strand break repair helicase AddA [Parvularculaceae bacterium]